MTKVSSLGRCASFQRAFQVSLTILQRENSNRSAAQATDDPLRLSSISLLTIDSQIMARTKKCKPGYYSQMEHRRELALKRASEKTSVDDSPEPSSQVLSLVSAFLSTHGFDSTSKALRKELKKKNQVTGLELFEVPDDGVDLQSIVQSWTDQRTQSPTSGDESLKESEATTSGSDSESSSATSSEASNKSDSSEAASESDSDMDSDSEEEESTKPQVTKVKKLKVKEREASPAASSSSDSDADDENENKAKVKLARRKSPTAKKKTEPIRSLKRKAASSTPETSSSESESSENDRPTKRAKVATDVEASSNEDASSVSAQDSSVSEVSSSESEEESNEDTSTSEEDEEDEKESKPPQSARPKSLAKLMTAAAEAPSDSSSNTVMGDAVEAEAISSDPEDPRSVNSAGRTQVATKKKHVGAQPTPLARLSAHATPDAHISNAYKSYDYADRAYNDLSVTRGKGFTKEKNKKKRGSYRGGAIDTSGGKSFKFDD